MKQLIQHRNPRWSRAAAWAGLAALLAACGKEPSAEPPLAAAPLTPQQTEALAAMNQAGRQAYEGRSWRYEFGVGCVLRVRHFFSSREEPYTDQPMTGVRIDVVAYAGSGFGVKVYAKGTGADLFDSVEQKRADAFAEHLRVLVAPCGASK